MSGQLQPMVRLEARDDFEIDGGKTLKAGRYWGRIREVDVGASTGPLRPAQRYWLEKGPEGEELSVDVTELVRGGELTVV